MSSCTISLLPSTIRDVESFSKELSNLVSDSSTQSCYFKPVAAPFFFKEIKFRQSFPQAF